MDLKVIVSEVASAAIKRAGSPSELAQRIYPMVGKLYRDRTAYSWGEGASPPNALVFLALAKVAQVSVDQYLFGPESLEERIGRVEVTVQKLIDGPNSIFERVRRVEAKVGLDDDEVTA